MMLNAGPFFGRSIDLFLMLLRVAVGQDEVCDLLLVLGARVHQRHLRPLEAENHKRAYLDS